MAEKHRPSRWQIGVALGIAALVLCLQAFGIHSFWSSSERVIGVYFGSEAEPLKITGLVPGGPADDAGFQSDDRVVAIDGYELRSVEDYETPADRFRRGEPARFVVERGGERIELTVRPGLSLNWPSIAFHILVLLLCLGLGLLTLSQSRGDLRGRLLAWFFFLLAFEFSLFQSQASYERSVYLVAEMLFYLGTGAQFAVELHLVSLIPRRQPWLRRVGWTVPLVYAVGLGMGLATAAAYVLEVLEASYRLPWTYEQAYWLLMEVGLPVWATAILVLLALPAFRYPEAEGRQQALLILLGLLPWIVYVYYTTALSLAGQTWPTWLNEFFPLVVIFFPIAVFIAIYRYQLFDMELVVRRSLLYTALTGVLVTAFYLLVGGLGLLTSRVLGDDHYSIWAAAAAMFFVGLLFGTVRSTLQDVIDRLFFPERRALRQRLVELSAELPSRGTVSGMGAHLVERLCEIFGISGATLFLSDPKSEVFYTVAGHPGPREGSAALSSLVPADDPVLQRLREQARPMSARGVLDLSPTLSRQFSSGDIEIQTLVPLLSRERLIGFLALGQPEPRRTLRREELELLNLMAVHVGTSFENIHLFASATYESLTGLMRRGSTLELLDREIERAQRYGRPLVAGMADLDFFKSVNDRYGHLAGDAVLKHVADELADGLRSTDSIGRYGGEEFLLVLPETGLEGGLAVAEKLRRRIESLELPMSDGTTIAPRISIGLASLADQGSGTDRDTIRTHLLEAADRALYRAKERGRNRVEVLDEPISV